ncbi:phosphoribosylamine--glycine ligase [Deinococcus yavapaiensis]|uniref:Phosphoribosylamine--glycine ligase n=1 Tax=Deinococcus yavapaiensis KR-236 TaxID=694435 RepID=A0A318S6J3_9DEIO|nr:phosphoribosylamine--glycine ligase [Deinococcus yavapaiensis]PYE53337.1 phosphoribosylamine--glycine ligase [Deinococcus yavapaiensis KR-236]
MKVLLLGGGGREHALAEAIRASRGVTEVLCTPGNPGIASVARVVACEQTATALADLAQRESVDLTIVGPEALLVQGVADEFARRGLKLFGPSRAAARIEGDKAWSKAFMVRHGIPTASHESFDSLREALAYAASRPLPIVVKDAGLRAGKGVTICTDHGQAEAALRDIFAQKEARAVVEEFMSGQEVTILAFSDGERFVTMPPSQDHKTIFEGDVGPMTGGMGVICPFPMSPRDMVLVERDILAPTLRGLREEGCAFVGVLYAGLMLTSNGPKVVEFNCRFGDPEAEAVLPLLESDFVEIATACVEGRLDASLVRFSGRASAVVVMAAPGYPGEPLKGTELTLPSLSQDERIYHAGTARRDGRLVSSGGRVLAVQACAPDLALALTKAYDVVARVDFEQAQVRRDIGFRVGAAPAARA